MLGPQGELLGMKASAEIQRDPLAQWREFLERGYGLHCEQADGRPCTAQVETFAMGEARLTDVRMSALTLSPRCRVPPDEEHLYVKLVESGSLMLEQNGERFRLPANSLAIVDPSVPFVERFDEKAHLIVLTCPRSALRERAYHHHFGHWVVPDMRSADVRMVHDMIRFVALRQGDLTESTKALLGAQLIDLMDVLVDGAASANLRSTTAAFYRTKRYIAQHLGDEALDAASIANGVRLSVGYLNRLFRDEGTSLMRYLWRQRLELACELLRTSKDGKVRVEEIAWRCGFTSAAHFSRRFRLSYGMTPTEWRLSIGHMSGSHKF
jgi:AraC-like DNA-binding protein